MTAAESDTTSVPTHTRVARPVTADSLAEAIAAPESTNQSAFLISRSVSLGWLL